MNCRDCQNYLHTSFKDWSDTQYKPAKGRTVRVTPGGAYRTLPQCLRAREAAIKGYRLIPSLTQTCETDYFTPKT